MHKKNVIDKISNVLEATDDGCNEKLINLLDKAKHIFLAGAGRSGLICRFFAMRLMHCGYDVHIVGEIVTPSIKAGDMLIVISGSGETEQLVSFSKKARKIGAQIVLISAKSNSSIADFADEVFQIGRSELYEKNKGMPMGTVFELSSLIFLESIISYIIHKRDIPEEEMKSRHANLE